jgi:quercetin dioxygenase-like cupin family protein
MRNTRFWTDPSGESHLEPLELTFAEVENYALGIPVVGMTKAAKADSTLFVKFSAGWIGDWHPSPRRQQFILVEGRMGAMTTDGQEIAIEPGDCGVLEDTAGRGHKSWVVGDRDALMVMVTLPVD